LARELEEELGLIVDPAQAEFRGEFTAPAANEPGFEVNCQLYDVRTDAQALPAAEIAEVPWVDADSHARLQLAPGSRGLHLPLYLQRQSARS
ncbi:NUDIX domain-containing protein, partial [Pseudomonas syringae]